MNSKVLAFVFFTLISLSILYPHGVDSQLINGGIGLIVSYDDGTPISYADTKVFSPKERNVPFQEGVTDKNGRFLFVPDETGIWKISINDGMGHGLIKEINIKNLNNLKVKNKGQLPRWYKILIGLSIIFGLTGFALFIKVSKILKEDKDNAHS
jgi:nickel transport protein